MSFLPRDQQCPTTLDRPTVEWEETICPLCSGPRWCMLVEAADPSPDSAGLRFAVVQCQDCGLCYTNPRPSESSILRFYSESYPPYRPSSHVKRRKRWLGGLWRDGQLVPRFGKGRLLDFGCGNGAFLVQMRQAGWQVTGLDISPATVRHLRGELALSALEGSLPHPELPDESFEVITMWSSLEHVHRPLEVLRAAQRLLVPGGKLLVSAPNIDSLPFRWFGPHWFGLDLPRHLTHFTPWTLRLMLERAGFQVGPVRMVRHSSWLRASAARAGRHATPALGWQWLTQRPLAGLAAWYSVLVGQADCMSVTATRGVLEPAAHDLDALHLPPPQPRFSDR